MLAKLTEMAEELTGLERHFRLANQYLKRNRTISKDFAKTLGPEWLRFTHDSKNPLVIGLGGPGIMTIDQKRDLGISACVGTMVEYKSPIDGVKKASSAYVANLSLNTDKTSYATLEHFFHSLTQSPIRELIESKKYIKIEICSDNAPCYISKEFVYGVTKRM